MSEVTVNFKDIMALPFYQTIKNEFVIAIKLTKTTVFPSTGVFVFAIGAIFILIMVILKTKVIN